jgi:hypothetical protein
LCQLGLRSNNHEARKKTSFYHDLYPSSSRPLRGERSEPERPRFSSPIYGGAFVAVANDFSAIYWNPAGAAEGYTEILMAWEDKTQIRFGAEYTLNPGLALRAGYCHDPAPSPDETMNVLLPSFSFNTFTSGVGFAVSSEWKIDAGLEYMAGKDRIIEYSGHNDPGTFTMKMVIPSISVSRRF